jgi:hypothetical protein
VADILITLRPDFILSISQVGMAVYERLAIKLCSTLVGVGPVHELHNELICAGDSFALAELQRVSETTLMKAHNSLNIISCKMRGNIVSKKIDSGRHYIASQGSGR